MRSRMGKLTRTRAATSLALSARASAIDIAPAGKNASLCMNLFLGHKVANGKVKPDQTKISAVIRFEGDYRTRKGRRGLVSQSSPAVLPFPANLGPYPST